MTKIKDLDAGLKASTTQNRVVQRAVKPCPFKTRPKGDFSQACKAVLHPSLAARGKALESANRGAASVVSACIHWVRFTSSPLFSELHHFHHRLLDKATSAYLVASADRYRLGFTLLSQVPRAAYVQVLR